MTSTGALIKTILFLGAGASSVAGYHTFAAFPDLIFSDEMRNREKLGELHSTTRILLREVEQSLHITGKATTHDNFLWALKDYTNLWHVLRVDDVLRSRFLKSTIQWSEFAHFSRTVEDAIHDLTITTVRHYSKNKVQTSRETNPPNYEYLHGLFDFYRFLAINNNAQTPYLPVFTTNYDLLLEDLFSEFSDHSKASLRLVNGISDYQRDGCTWTEREYEGRPKGVHLYRLHGCVSWFSSQDDLIQYCRDNSFQYPLANLCAIYPGSELSLGRNPHAYGFRKLNQLLLNCATAVFIGFSFRDHDVLHILLSAIARRKRPLKLIVVDPTLTPGIVMERLSNASLRTQHPVCMPAINDIICINIRYGINNFAEVINQAIDQSLNN